MTGNRPRCQDLTISGHDLSHPEVEEGSAALSKAEAGSNSWGFGVTLEGSGFRGFYCVISCVNETNSP